MERKILRSLNKKILLALTIAMLISILPYSMRQVLAVEESNFEITWSSAFGGTGNDQAFSVVAVNKANEEDTVVEGYVMAGTVTDPVLRMEYASLIKTDKKGKLLWQRRYGGAFLCSGRSVSRTKDGGFIIAGTIKNLMESNDRVYIVKTDSEGKLEWERKLDLATQGYSNSKRQGFSIKEVDGGYVIAGMILRGDTSDALIIKTNSDGMVLWAHALGGTQWDWFYDVEAVPDGYIVGGSTEKDNRAYEYLVKVNPSGDIVWEHKGKVPGSQIKDLGTSDDGALVATGYRTTNISMFKFDSNKNFFWENVFDAGIGYCAAPLGSGDFVIAGNDKIVGVKADGTKAWVKDLSMDSCYAKGVAIDSSGSMIFAGFRNGDEYLFELATDRASLGISATSVIKGGTIYLYSPVFLKNGELDKTGLCDVEVVITEDGVEIPLKLEDMNRDNKDNFGYLDGIYSGSYKITGDKNVMIDLFVDGIKEDYKIVEVITNFDLVVLTDYKQLYGEFIDTQTASEAEEDVIANRMPDFYDLVERIREYALDHAGIIVDVSKDMTIGNGWPIDYSSLSYDAGNAITMATNIDSYIKKLSGISAFKNVAIIGDDEVIPFYRKTDPTVNVYPTGNKTNEEEYVSGDMGGNMWGNPTLTDSGNKKIMTDIPYTSYNDTDPDTVPFPFLDAGVGRIFANRPSTLVNMIDGYETPINLIPEKSKAMVFALDNDLKDSKDGVNFPFTVSNSIIKVLKTKYKDPSILIKPPYNDGCYYWFDGTIRKWSGQMVAEAVEGASVTVLWSHADHFHEMTQGNPDITYATFQNINPSPGHIFINAGCHSGYSASHNNKLSAGASYKPYDKAMVNSIISKQAGYLAPSVYGLSSNDYPTCHDLLEKEFLNSMLSYGAATVGKRLVDAYTGYVAWYGGRSGPSSIYAAYGTVYYGLPTQNIVTTDAELAAFEASKSAKLAAGDKELSPLMDKAGGMPAAAGGTEVRRSMTALAVNSIKVSVDIPEFKRTVDGDGKVTYEIPNSNSFTKTDFAPILPLIVKTYAFPKGTIINNVTLENQVKKLADEQAELKTLVTLNKTLGETQGSFELTSPYPAEIFSWIPEEREDGVYLKITIIPIQYDHSAKQVTLYESMDLNVDCSIPVNSAEITGAVVNNGTVVKTGEANIPVNVKIACESDQTCQMEWSIRDTEGLIIESGSMPVLLTAGENQTAFSFDTMGWNPGSKDLTVSIKGDTLLSSYLTSIPVTGLSLDIEMKERVFDPADGKITFSAWVQDENGLGVSGLTADKFSTAIDGIVAGGVTVSEMGNGSYSFEIPLFQLTEDVHRLQLTCTDSGRSAEAAEDFAVRADIAPPEVVKTTPSLYQEGVELNQKITIEFDKLIFQGEAYDSIALAISSSDGDMSVDITKSIDYGKLIIIPVEELEPDTIYKVVIPAGAVVDKKAIAFMYPYSYKFITYALPDLTAPEILSHVPAAGSAGFPSKSAVIINFSESVSAGANEGGISWLAGGRAVPFSLQYYAAKLILTPQKPLPFDAGCKITLPAGSVNDSSGNTLGAEYSFVFNTEAGPDIKAPDVSSVIPEQGESGALAGTAVSIKFDEIILKGEKISSLLLTDDQGVSIPFTADVQRETLAIRPQQNLEFNKGYKVVVPASAVEDLTGNKFAVSREFAFTTGLPVDTASPAIVETIPSNNAKGVFLDAGVYIYFDEVILQGDNYDEISLHNISNAPAGEEGEIITIAARIDGRTLSIKSGKELKYGSVYRVKVPAGAVKDLNGNSTTADTIFEFSTVNWPDTIKPVMSGSSPSNGASNCPVDQTITLSFNEDIAAGSDFQGITFRKGSIDIPFVITVGGNKLTIKPENNLDYGTGYVVTIPSCAIGDLTGNELAESLQISFTTAAVPVSPGGGDGTTIPGGGTTNPGGGETTIPEEKVPGAPALNIAEHIAFIQGYPENVVKPEGFITREEAATVFCKLLDPAYRESINTKSSSKFNDVLAGRWSAGYIEILAEGGIIQGYPDGSFKPDNNITRAELASITAKFGKLENTDGNVLSDISGNWAEKFINSAYKKDWINGYPDGTFKPDQYITRAEFVTVVNSMLSRKVHTEHILPDIKRFPDLVEGMWYYEAMTEAINSHYYERLPDGSEKWLDIYKAD